MLSAANQLSLRVDRIRAEARDVLSLELVSARGESLPSWTPGSHIDLVLPNGLVRQYSLCNLDQRADRYRIAVARSASSEGGSELIYDTVRRGAELHGRGPRNNFLPPHCWGHRHPADTAARPVRSAVVAFFRHALMLEGAGRLMVIQICGGRGVRSWQHCSL
jgi:NAD(P)H-flavin reductase